MKRSKNIRLVLLGSLASIALTGCERKPSISADNFYTNNFYVPGAGYYHAPFRNWYALPYNHFDAQKQLYYYGGQWNSQPFASITNISSPTTDAVTLAEAARTDISRGGFGGYGYSGGHYWGGSSHWGGLGFHS
ncbi:MAG TPA: hypothetical protein VGO57_19355 [Verrucomicrobiae bacterium]